MDPGDDPAYKKWRFDGKGEQSRSTLWRRKKLKRKLESYNDEDELFENEVSQAQPDPQDRDALGHGAKSTSYHERQRMDPEVREVMQAAQKDDDVSSFDAHPRLDYVSSSAESAADHIFNDFVNLMQDISANANEEVHEESTSVHDEIQGTFTEELADLIEEIEVEKVAAGTEETKEESIEDELLYEDSRITVGESLLLTMAFIMRHKMSMVASNDLISLLELHCPKENNTVKGMSQFREYFQYLKHPMKKHFCCPNPKCQVYISAEKPKDGDVCRICSESLSGKSFFIELPIEDQSSIPRTQ